MHRASPVPLSPTPCRALVAFALAVTCLALPSTSSAQPANDACSAATVFNVSFTDTLSNTTATTGPEDQSGCACGASNSRSVWYTYTATAAGCIQVDTRGSNFDTVLDAYTGSCEAQSRITCNDDYFGVQSFITFNTTPGTTYLVRASGYCSSGGGNMNVHFNVATGDPDGDGIACGDNCPYVSNPDQHDTDGDGVGDACDPCNGTANDPNDADGDGVTCHDNCLDTTNADQADADGDGVGDACDVCPGMPDGEAQDLDDGDGDGARCTDNCIGVANPDQLDTDGDGFGDACDTCPLEANPNQQAEQDPGDSDHDGRACIDDCPHVYNPDQLDTDEDGLGDACDPCNGAGAIISNGVVTLGVNCEGHLNTPMQNDPLGIGYMGLRYVPTGGASTEPGCQCEGWGVADNRTRVAGYANLDSDNGAHNIVVEHFTATASAAISRVRVGSTFIVEHDYHPSARTPNLYEVVVRVTNTSTSPVELLYRRVMDWDISPTEFHEFVTIVNGNATDLFRTDTNGFNSSNPFSFESYTPGPVTDVGPDDIGATFDFDFGEVPAGHTKVFRTFYGAAGNEVDALTALTIEAAEAFSLGEPNTERGRDYGEPNTFMFGFAGIGGTAVFCGDGFQNPGEECDDGNLVDGDGCDSNCRMTACGNGVVTPGELCDDGNAIDGDGCDSNCTPTGCGNGIISPDETCEDGNTLDGDCCSSTCQIESPLVVCRASVGACDLAETCDGATPECPEDEKSTDVCREAAGACDVPEVCDGESNDCPSDIVAGVGGVCREAADICDVAESCDGVHAECPADTFLSGAVCREVAGVCDVAERCDGTSAACPPDGFLGPDTPCRTSVGGCDQAEVCSGHAADCPPDLHAANGTPCYDGVVCNGSEACEDGACELVGALACDDHDPCTTETCTEPGGCGATRIPGCCAVDGDCNDHDACTTDACTSGRCTHAAIALCCNSDRDCSDGDSCTVDVCSGPGGTCSHDVRTNCCNTTADCDDGVACTADACNMGSHTCQHTPTAGCCHQDADCADRNPCTTDSCDQGTGLCSNAAVAECCVTAADCADEDVCTSDVCSDRRCAHNAIAACCVAGTTCDDGDSCTTDQCNLAINRCEGTPVAGCCNTAADCDDGNSCTTDSCTGSGGTCQHSAGEGACCALDSDCDDLDPCTVDHCTGEVCVHTSIDGCVIAQPDAGVPDAGEVDAEPQGDAGAPDATITPDTGLPDLGIEIPDAAIPDGFLQDGSLPDGFLRDGAIPWPDASTGDQNGDGSTSCQCGAVADTSRHATASLLLFVALGAALALRRRR